MNRTTICLIDDEIALREVVRRYLEHEGYRVIEIETGAEALNLSRPDPHRRAADFCQHRCSDLGILHRQCLDRAH
jgi:CheY-like chemotaxis protein